MADAANDAVIKVKDLVVGFGDQIVLDHLSLDVRRGEILGVVGASGSGKSVLLRTVIGLLPERGGTISFDGVDGEHDGDTDALARHWGVLFQQGALFSSLTVRQNVAVSDAGESAALRGPARGTRQRPSLRWSGCRPATATNFRPKFPAA